jgi:hypothetical protein
MTRINAGISAQGATSTGIGGTNTSLFSKEFNNTAGQRLNVDTLASTSSITFPAVTHGVEGTSTRLYIGGSAIMYELDTSTYTIIATSGSIRTPNGRDVGCTSTRLFSMSDSAGFTNLLQEFDVNTFATIRSANAPSGANTNNVGIGGTNTRLFSSDVTTSLIYELDLDTLTSIATYPATLIYGIGGIKTV